MKHDKHYSRPDDDELKGKLDELQYSVMVESATERPFSSPYQKVEGEGIYVDAGTGEPLFTTYDQFESECGWPSFTQPLYDNSITTQPDDSHGMQRTEVRSGDGDFHLGHVFEDGPKDRGGLRYCINGAAIRFIPTEDLEAEGYDYLIPYLKERQMEAKKSSTPESEDARKIIYVKEEQI